MSHVIRDRTRIVLLVNDQKRTVEVEPRMTLLDVLRQKLDLTGSKRVCDSGSCGACTVIVNGTPVYGCMTLAIACDGAAIETIEGLSDGESLHPIQRAFIEKDGYQCGFCTPGQIMAAMALLDENPEPSADEIERGMAGNLCRCGAYQKIRGAVARAAVLLKEGGE